MAHEDDLDVQISELKKKLLQLEAQQEDARKEKIAEVVASIRAQINEFGLKPADLFPEARFPLAAVIFAIVAFEMGVVLIGGFSMVDEPKVIPTVVDAAGKVIPYSNVKALGTLLYTEYLFPVQIAAVILLVAMIAAIALTLRHRKDSKAIDASLQVRVRAEDRLKLVKVETVKPAAPVVQEAAATEEKKA